MKSIERASFLNEAEFREYAGKTALMYFHVFSGSPDQGMMDALSECGPEEALVLLDVEEDRGFLKEAGLDKRCGLGAWTKSAFIDFTDTVEGVLDVVRNGRRFAFPPVRTSEEKERLIKELSRPPASRNA